MSKSLSPETLAKYNVKWGPIGEPVYKRSYSRTKEDGSKEIWPETVVRAVDGNIGLVDKKFIESDEREKLIDLLLEFAAIPAGRHLYASGVKGRQFLFNCHAAGWDTKAPWDHFGFLFDELMQGGGVGSNYSNRYMQSLPPIQKSIDLHVVCRPDHPNIAEFQDLLCKVTQGDVKSHSDVLKVPDTREGWVEAVEHILKAAWSGSDSSESRIVIDVSGIRARGELLKTSGGIACGPGPLVSMLHDFTKQLNGCIGRTLTSLDAMVLDHALASCVIAGGKRRSSRMSVKSWKDSDIFEFINCKRQDGAHWSTNISVEVDDEFISAYNSGDEHAKSVMRAVTLGKRSNGEPGLWNRSLAMKDERDPELMFCPNPCGEIGLQMWENCNLGHINLQHFASKPNREAAEAFRLMTRWLIRATFGDIPQPRQREVVDRNRRIGVGFFGYHGWLAIRGFKYSEAYKEASIQNTLNMFKTTVQNEAREYSGQMNIPCPVKNTTLAPTGTIVLMPGVSASGQAVIYRHFKRLVRYADTDPELEVKRKEGYKVFKDDDARNTQIVEYWCEDPLVSVLKAKGLDAEELVECQDEIKLEDSLGTQRMIQEFYADNAISFTINMGEDKMPTEDVMERAFVDALPYIKGTTFFPEKSRKNAPYQKLSKAEWDAYTGRKETIQVEDECKTGCPVR